MIWSEPVNAFRKKFARWKPFPPLEAIYFPLPRGREAEDCVLCWRSNWVGASKSSKWQVSHKPLSWDEGIYPWSIEKDLVSFCFVKLAMSGVISIVLQCLFCYVFKRFRGFFCWIEDLFFWDSQLFLLCPAQGFFFQSRKSQDLRMLQYHRSRYTPSKNVGLKQFIALN